MHGLSKAIGQKWVHNLLGKCGKRFQVTIPDEWKCFFVLCVNCNHLYRYDDVCVEWKVFGEPNRLSLSSKNIEALGRCQTGYRMHDYGPNQQYIDLFGGFYLVSAATAGAYSMSNSAGWRLHYHPGRKCRVLGCNRGGTRVHWSRECPRRRS